MSKAEQPKAPLATAPASAAATAPATTPSEAPRDVLFVHSPTEDGGALRVIRKREDSLEIGELRALEEGRPVHGDVIRLHQREESERLFDVEVLMEGPRPQRSLSGPPQVATEAYRSGWDAIFGPPDGDSGALN